MSNPDTLRAALAEAREYVLEGSTRYYDGTNGGAQRAAASSLLTRIDAALATPQPAAMSAHAASAAAPTLRDLLGAMARADRTFDPFGFSGRRYVELANAEMLKLCKRPDEPAAPVAGAICTCPSGDGSLRWPCPAHPAPSEAWIQRFVEPAAAGSAEPAQPATQEAGTVACAADWWALVMGAAASLEDASHCLRDDEARRAATGAAAHYRAAAQKLYATPQAPAAPSGSCLPDLDAAAARKWQGDPDAQRAGLFARAAAEIRGLQAPAASEPDMRHPKIQRLIGSKARREIELRLVEALLDDPEFETSAIDMEYWNSLHDKLKEALTKNAPAAPVWRRLTDEEIDAKIGSDEGDREAVTAVVRETESALAAKNGATLTTQETP